MAQSTSWTGLSNTSWANAANWSNGVPTSSLDVIIGDASFTGNNQPTIGRTAAAKSLTLGGVKASTLTVSKGLNVAGNITILSNGTLTHGGATITVVGNWSNSGTYSATSNKSVLTFAGTSQSITGSNSTTFRRVRVNTTSTLAVSTNFTITGAVHPCK